MMITTSTQTHKNTPKPFDIHSDEDHKELKAWCRIHWQYTLCKGIQGCNAPTFHDCCLSFSRKGCVKRSSHPSIQSCSVLKIPTLKNTSNHEELFRWLKERLRLHSRLGKKTYFPSINVAHFTDDEDENVNIEEQMEVLGKRYHTTLLELDKVREENSRLTDDNMRLASASKSWCVKYQELLYKHQEETASYTQYTPIKPLRKEEDQELLKL